jgi:hypothetical protein
MGLENLLRNFISPSPALGSNLSDTCSDYHISYILWMILHVGVCNVERTNSIVQGDAGRMNTCLPGQKIYCL